MSRIVSSAISRLLVSGQLAEIDGVVRRMAERQKERFGVGAYRRVGETTERRTRRTRRTREHAAHAAHANTPHTPHTRTRRTRQHANTPTRLPFVPSSDSLTFS
jgi:hypothetical protein